MYRTTWLVLLVSLLAGCSGGPQDLSATTTPSGEAARTAEPTEAADAREPAAYECERCQADVAGHKNCFRCAKGRTFCATCTLELGQRCPNCAGTLKPRP